MTLSDKKLENIGFYTLSDTRCVNSSHTTPLWRAELILTDLCNFRCPYCRGLREDIKDTLPFEKAMETLRLWVAQGLKNVRFSGGEPTLYKGLEDLVSFCKQNGVERIAISTNGSAKLDTYKKLVEAGVNDFSISLDGACCAVGDAMAGNIKGAWDKVVSNIAAISKFCYVTVGIVFTEDNVGQAIETIEFADSLGVADIRIISSAQYNQAIQNLDRLNPEILERHPILKYRIMNHRASRPMRGIDEKNSHRCKLVLDDMAVAGGKHFPCIIYMREGGNPIGEVSEAMREERLAWYKAHNSFEDQICRKNCLDVCVEFNDRAAQNS